MRETDKSIILKRTSRAQGLEAPSNKMVVSGSAIIDSLAHNLLRPLHMLFTEVRCFGADVYHSGTVGNLFTQGNRIF
ncbi:unnamed protein product [Periconia digitata]|uniref:Uncharacterized protein n=1 Tax=Periconia digitata TaxID=1303443 RepID=A0A9W4UUH9_9PLEO|nr:unnamed protein product [Periconia digitata]